MGGLPYGGAPQPEDNTPKTLGILAIIVGAVGVLIGCCCWPVGIPISIAAVAMAGIGYTRIKHDPNHPDRVLLIVALVLSGLSTAMTVLGIILGVLNLFTGWSEF